MKFVERFAKAFGIVSVRQAGNHVRVTGLDAVIMRHHFKKIFETDILVKMMFTTITDTSFSIHEFFLPDLLYMLEQLRVDPACGWSGRRTIDKIVSGIMKNTWYNITTQPFTSMIDTNRLKLLKWKPLPHQEIFLEDFGQRLPKFDLRGLLLGAAPGTGKTALDIFVMTCFIPPSVAEIKIIISPKKAVELVWGKTLRGIFHKPPTVWTSASGTPMPKTGCEYYVFNFEQLDNAIALGKSIHASGKRFFVSVDESHNFADFKSNRTQKLITLQTLRKDVYFLWLSGSPILKHAAELTTFLKCADPRFDQDAERRFRRIYSSSQGRAGEIFYHRFGKMMGVLIPKSAVSNTKPTVRELPVKLPPALAHKFLLSTIKEEMREFIVERVKLYETQIKVHREIVKQGLDAHEKLLRNRAEGKLFDVYRKNLKVIMNTPDRVMTEAVTMTRIYERTKLFPMMAPRDRREFRNALSAVKNIKLKVRGEALGIVLSKRRSECSAVLGLFCKPDVIMKESLSKTIFFASSVRPVKVLDAFLRSKGFEPLPVYADTNAQLVAMMDRFDNDPNANPVIATMQSLSEAVPVISASTIVLLNRPFRSGHYDQVVARADRLGQIHPVTIIEVTLDTDGEPNVSSRTDEILAEVRLQINTLIGKDFAGPDPSEREYSDLIDASDENQIVVESDEKMGL
jgi:hypothetical protein